MKTLVTTMLLGLAVCFQAADWPNWRGPVTGKLVTDLITQGKPELEVDLLKLAPERFG